MKKFSRDDLKVIEDAVRIETDYLQAEITRLRDSLDIERRVNDRLLARLADMEIELRKIRGDVK